MTRLQTFAGVAGFGLLLAAAANPGASPRASRDQDPQQIPAFRSGTSLVRVDATVRDGSRRIIEGLTAADFTVLDNGVEQHVDDVTFGKAPIDVTIGLDVSHSVAGPLLDRLRLGVMQLARDLHNEDRLRLLVFNLETRRLVDFTRDTSAIERAMNTATAGGGTALFDALSIAMISTAPEPERRQLVVCFTDGQDGGSTTSGEALLSVAERTRATVSFVVLPTTLIPSAPSEITQLYPAYVMTNPSMPSRVQELVIHPAVQRLARDTGGQILPAMQGASLGLAFLGALDAFRATYVLHYSPRGVTADGFHAISVQVKRTGAVVQARRGYFAR